MADCEISVGRELTKIHEELVRGPITTVLDGLSESRGEFTVVAFIGRITDFNGLAAPNADSLMHEFGEMTSIDGSTKRVAVSSLARKYGMPPNEVYRALERAKKSGE